MPQVSASLLAANFADMGRDVRRAEQAGVDSFHFDMMDGHYVPNLALSPYHLHDLRKTTRLPFHVHLELANPDEILDRFEPLQADLIIVCLDSLPNPFQTLARIRALGLRAGISLNPDERLEASVPYFPELDLLLILGVPPGFGGQLMRKDTVEKVAKARQLIQKHGLDIPVAVDGGVNSQTASALVEAGADILIVGSALFQSQDFHNAVRELTGTIAS